MTGARETVGERRPGRGVGYEPAAPPVRRQRQAQDPEHAPVAGRAVRLAWAETGLRLAPGTHDELRDAAHRRVRRVVLRTEPFVVVIVTGDEQVGGRVE